MFSLGHKKKFLGGYGLLFGVLFCLFLGFLSTTCYARTTLTDDEAEYLWNYFTQDTYDDKVTDNEYRNLFRNKYFGLKGSIYSDYTNFMNYFNTNNTLDISENTYFFFVYDNPNSYIYWYNFNIANSNDLPYLYLRFRPNITGSHNEHGIEIYAIEDNKTYTSVTGRRCTVYLDPNGLYFSNYSNDTITTSRKNFTLLLFP